MLNREVRKHVRLEAVDAAPVESRIQRSQWVKLNFDNEAVIKFISSVLTSIINLLLDIDQILVKKRISSLCGLMSQHDTVQKHYKTRAKSSYRPGQPSGHITPTRAATPPAGISAE
jgi:hypothetical protein